MAQFADGWFWEPTDLIVLRQASTGSEFSATPMYRMTADSLCDRNFLILTTFGGRVLKARLTTKGRQTAKKVLA